MWSCFYSFKFVSLSLWWCFSDEMNLNSCAPSSSCGIFGGNWVKGNAKLDTPGHVDLPDFPPLVSQWAQPLSRLKCSYTYAWISCALRNRSPPLFQWQLSSSTMREKFLQGENSSLMVAMETENCMIIWINISATCKCSATFSALSFRRNIDSVTISAFSSVIA